ncbi:hypothetical protein Sbal625DRAFT_0028 [Shewanella baltica OS625]|nr:hypothetical protein [Shewanella baltica]EHC07697.1 hypothetical protein Sbal625DRAFT_0028 [Shewanella baltica OS625]
MTAIIVFLTAVLALAGVSVAVWSLINTRNKYFKDYKGRKRND